MMTYGFKTGDLNYIIKALKKFKEIEKATIFGSRAKGNYKHGSDVDIAIYGEEISWDTVSSLHWILEEEVPLPYFFDIVDYTHLDHQELKEHIDRVGKVIYIKD